MNDIERLTETIIGCAIDVHRVLGPGLLESAYRECMGIEFTIAGLTFESEHHVALSYKGKAINTRLRIDLLVERAIVVS